MTTNRHRILLVDDDPGLLKLLSMRLQAAGYDVDPAENGERALAAARRARPDLVVTDLRMDTMDGMQLLDELATRLPGLPVILLTAHGTIPDAVAATRRGAFGFLTKPVDREQLLDEVQRALRVSAPATDSPFPGILTRSARMQTVLAEARSVAATDSSVLILGESGTGKELLSRAIHDHSPRREGPFVAINCAAIPAELMEAELFGHERGAFTGATQKRVGLLQSAHGGTVLLDEIGDMPLPLQAKLLRVLQDRKVRPVGAVQDIEVDFRVVSATHRELAEAIAEGGFREDLYYRLNVVSLNLPPLRERREDIPLLTQAALAEVTANGERKVFAPESMELMAAAEWPGNIRQLRNVVEQSVALSAGSVIGPATVAKALGGAESRMPSFAEARDEFTRQYLTQLLNLTEGNVSRAARLAQRNRTEFYKLLARHQVEPDQFKPPASPDDDS